MAGIGLEIPNTLLIGYETEIETIFRVDGPETEAVKLKVSIKEQRSLTGSTNGSQISYKDANGNQHTFSDSFEKLLSELSAAKGLSEFKVNFSLGPASEAIKVKLHFELLDGSDKSIRGIEVEWIKSEIVIRLLEEVKEGETSFTLQNLKEDIKDLNKITLSIQSPDKNIGFLVNKSKKTEATLAELLPGTSKVARNQETRPIKMALYKPKGNKKPNRKPEFLILILTEQEKKVEKEGSSLDYKRGFHNALRHNMFGTSLKQPKSLQYYNGQQAGHRVSAGIARAELSVGPPLFGVGVGATIAGGVPTFGGIAVVTIPIMALGGSFIGHGIYTSERAQANLTASQNAKK
jgi:hypothetical protein